ncbi:hypothetical protein I317_06840 [Kwoniella heveanensis CBS 569]|nr:hypothetical protein I317_06840 [Kwoniella heveanensis CBS 569]
MRVGLPLDMPYKVESEVATAHFLRTILQVPTPRVLGYDSTNENELRFPWILMEFVPGQNFADKEWRDISMIKKRRLVTQLAHFHSRLFNHHFAYIGSLTTGNGSQNKSLTFNTGLAPGLTPPGRDTRLLSLITAILLMVLHLPNLSLLLALIYLWTKITKGQAQPVPPIGRCSSLDFFASSPSTSRGPFDTATEWVYTRLHDVRARWISGLQPNAPEAVLKRQLKMVHFTTRLLKCVPVLFDGTCSEDVMSLLAADLHWGNVMVDEDNDLVAYIDWEFITAVPLWAAATLPDIFPIRDYNEPKKERYPLRVIRGQLETGIGGVNKMYWFNLRDYEDTVLRNHFLAEMANINPGWTREYHNPKSKQKRDFLQMIIAAEGFGLFDPHYNTWLDRFERGESTAGVLEGLFDNWGND